ncbi:MAG: hypothetical protein QOK25_1404 [Thermoleophilaceae bacterium]|nr:hypothetical protein [Thermoleophilaceae bacterium]
MSGIALADGRALDRPAEIALAAATVIAVVAVAAALARLLRTAESRSARSRLTPALAILTGGAAITFTAYLAYSLRCGGAGCRPGGGDGVAGFHHWWRAHDSWQWSGQLLVASVGLAIAAIALWLGARDSRRRRLPLWIARLLYTAWAAIVFLPVLYELVSGAL